MLYLVFSDDCELGTFDYVIEGPPDLDLQELDTKFYRELMCTPGIQLSGNVTREVYNKLVGVIPLTQYSYPTEERCAYISRYTMRYKVAFADWLVKNYNFTKPEVDKQILFF